MRAQAVAWAEQHDWFVNAFQDDDSVGQCFPEWTVTVEERGTNREGAAYSERLNFTSVRELRNWAGY